jgi:hypothetical protein
MAAAPNSLGCIFPLFPKFPAEIRNQIWRDALPGAIGPGLFFFKKECWDPRRKTEADNWQFGYYPDRDGLNWNFTWHHKRLTSTQYTLPLFFVNREARSIAVHWLHTHGISIRYLPISQKFGFTRLFDPLRDAVYVSLDQWKDFYLDPHDRFQQPDILGRSVTVEADLWHLAVPGVVTE